MQSNMKSKFYLVCLVIISTIKVQGGSRFCRLYHELALLQPEQLIGELLLRVSDTSLPDELLTTFEIQGDDVSIELPDNSDYVTWHVDHGQLEVRLSEQFTNYEFMETSPLCQLGEVRFSCGLRTNISMKLQLFVENTNNHAPFFVNPDEYVYLVQLPLRKGASLRKLALGPEIRAYDVDLGNKNIMFSIFGIHKRVLETVNVKRERGTWDEFITDVRAKTTIKKPVTFQILAQDSGNPPQIA
ncbi:hypothetical protein B566_EDAN016967, partial [Ephemera danica]